MADIRDEALIAELRGLADWLDVPEPADARVAVRSRLEARPTTTPRFTALRLAALRFTALRFTALRLMTARRRFVALVAAVVACLLVAVVPPARAAVSDAVDGLLRFAGIEISAGPDPAGQGGPGGPAGQPTASLPATPSPLPSVRSAALDEARRTARFPVRAPVALGPPESVELADPGPDGAPRVVTMSYRGGTVRLDQFDGELDALFAKRAPGAQFVDVDSEFAVWIAGPHPVTYIDRAGQRQTATARLAGPTLIWPTGVTTTRLEGVADLREAITIAESMT